MKRKELESKQRVIDNLLKTFTVCLHTQLSMRGERCFFSQSQKFSFAQNKLEKSIIAINDNKETFNAHKELASNDKETININEKTIKDDIHTNVYKINCNEETDTNFDNNDTVLQVNVNDNESTSKDIPEHQNKHNVQEKISSSQKSQNAPSNEKETSKKITKKNKNSSLECKRMYIIGVATSLKSDTSDVLVSSITMRNDKELCKEKNLHYINHDKKITVKRLNGSRLHLNKKGTCILSNRFVESISNALQSRSLLRSFGENRSGSCMINEYKASCLSESNKVASLYSIRTSNLNKLVAAHLNINSLRLKFDSLAQKITGNVDILMISETKLDNSFPEGQFLIEGYSKPYRIDRNCHGGGIMLYVRADIPSKLLSTELLPMEGFYVEINLQK